MCNPAYARAFDSLGIGNLGAAGVVLKERCAAVVKRQEFRLHTTIRHAEM